jgi:hypothetical protein
MMVVGLPNSGKSSLINAFKLSAKKHGVSGHAKQPGCQQQHSRVKPDQATLQQSTQAHALRACACTSGWTACRLGEHGHLLLPDISWLAVGSACTCTATNYHAARTTYLAPARSDGVICVYSTPQFCTCYCATAALHELAAYIHVPDDPLC